MCVALVFFAVDGRDDIRHPLAVRRRAEGRDIAQASQVVEFEWTFRSLRRQRGGDGND